MFGNGGIMRFAISAAVVISAVAASSQAAVTFYPAADVSYSHTANGNNVNTTSTPVMFNSGDRFLDGQSGSPVAAVTRYYGGVYSYTPTSNAQWGGGFSLRFNFASGGPVVFGKPAGNNELRIDAPTTLGGQPNAIGTYTGTETNLPFVVKFEDDNWNLATVKVFVGANATSLTEGTPDGMIDDVFSDIIVNSISTRFQFSDWASGTSTGQLSGFFASDTWTPVAIPEPTTLAALGVVACTLMARRRAMK
jgi:PEP-CTERM motif